MESKKRSLGASEPEEWLRVAWRVMVAEKIDPERLVFLETRWSQYPSLSPV
jgi:hypothetical protein